MSNISTVPSHADGRTHQDLRADRRPSLRRQALVELRKALDVRSGFWLPVGVAVVSVLSAIVAVLQHHGEQATYVSVFQNAAQPAALFLPVVGILLISSEFSQRTTLTTFTLTPRRGRVVAAKLLACLVVSTVALALGAGATYAVTKGLSNVPGGPGPFSVKLITQGWLLLNAEMVMGFAFGLVLQLSAPAIIAFLLAPMVWNMVLTSVHSLAGLARWINPYQTLLKLTQQLQSGTEWQHVAATIAVWVLVPLALGMLRLGRSDL